MQNVGRVETTVRTLAGFWSETSEPERVRRGAPGQPGDNETHHRPDEGNPGPVMRSFTLSRVVHHG
jgi:hypothetical protein